MTAALNEFGMKYRNETLKPEVYEELLTKDSEQAEMIQNMVKMKMAKLLVYFDDMLVVDIQEQPKYSAFSFLSNVGGAISLYLGVSLVAVFEPLVEIPIHLMASMFRPRHVGRAKGSSYN